MLKINITQDDIDSSKPMLEEFNPLGSALKRIFPNSIIHVGITKAQVDNLILQLSPQLVQYLENYDIDGKAEPIELELSVTIKG